MGTYKASKYDFFVYLIAYGFTLILISEDIVDAIDVTTDSVVSALIGGTDDLYIGAFNLPGSYFNGSIDSVKIYNRALSATQINALYLAGLPGHQ